MNHDIKVGLTMTYRKDRGYHNVQADTGATGLLEYLVTTPTILNMIIEASVQMLDSRLTDDLVTVGKRIELTHDRPTVVGEEISIDLTVTRIDRDHIMLDFVGHDSTSQICRGQYERVIVKKQDLIDHAYRRVQV